MANILYMAISRDGFIAGPHDETPWAEAEWEAFEAFAQSCDVLVVGRRTFRIMQDREEFVRGPAYVVATHDLGFAVPGFTAQAIDKPADMPQAARVGIIGGGDLNGRLAAMGVIDELILDIEPIELKAGTKLFGAHDVPLKLQLLGSQQIGEATVQRHYQIVA